MDKIFIKLNKECRGSPDSPILILSLSAYKKISFWTAFAARRGRETSGLGLVTRRHGGLYISQVWLLAPKVVSGGYTEMDPVAVGELMRELYFGRGVPRKDGVGFEGGRSLKSLRFLWHSHGNMGVGWSNTDNINACLDFCPDAKWTVNLVTNAAGQFLARMDFPELNHTLVRSEGGKKVLHEKTTVNNLPVWLLLKIDGAERRRLSGVYEEKHVGLVERTQGKKETDLFTILGKR